MSLVGAELGPPPGSAAPDSISHGMTLSAALHAVLGGLLVFGLPTLFHPPVPQEMPIAVDLVMAGPQTRATKPNPYTPRREAKPIAAEAPESIPVPKPKPIPPKPSPTPPPSAEEPPAPPPKPPPPKPQSSQTAMALPMPAPALEPKPTPPKIERPAPPLPREKPVPPPLQAKSPPRTEEKKYDAAQFRALLKNLSTQTAVPDPAARPDKPQAVALHASSQPRAPLGSQLTTNEMDMVRQQISHCWNVPAGARDAQDLVVEIRVEVNPDGMVRQAMIVDQARANSDPFFRAAAESARRAFFNPDCRPLRLPPDKYAIWKDLVVDFSPKDLL
jgi:outer membrane biosynthesis protein TonB